MNRKSKLDRVPSQPKLIDEMPSISLQQHRRQIALQRRGRDRSVLVVVVIISSLFFSILVWFSRGYYLKSTRSSVFQEKVSAFSKLVSELTDKKTIGEKPFQLVSADSTCITVSAELPAFLSYKCVASHSPSMDKLAFWALDGFSAGSVRPRSNEDEAELVPGPTRVDIFSPRDRSYVHCAFTSESSFNETTAQLSGEVFTLNAKDEPLDLFRPIDLSEGEAVKIAHQTPGNRESEIVVDLDLPAHVSHYCVVQFEAPEIKATEGPPPEQRGEKELEKDLDRESLMGLWAKSFLDEEYKDKMFFIFKNVVDSYKGISTFFSEEKKYKSRYDLVHFFSGLSVRACCVAATGVKEALAMKRLPAQGNFNGLRVDKTVASAEDLFGRIQNGPCRKVARSIHGNKDVDVDVDFYKLPLFFDSSSLLKNKLKEACEVIERNGSANKQLIVAVYDQGFQMAKLIHYIAGTGVVLPTKLKKVVESCSRLFGKYEQITSENESVFQNESLNEALSLLEAVTKKIMVLEEGGDKMVHRSERIARNMAIVEEIKGLWNKIGKLSEKKEEV